MRARGLHPVTLLLTILAVALLATGAFARDKDSRESGKEQSHATTLSIELEDDDLILTEGCGDDSRIVVMNMDAVEEMMDEAFAGVSDVLAELGDMQLEIRLGDDNTLSFADADTEWELDLGQIAVQIGAALEEGLGEFDSDEWTHSRQRLDDDMEDLQDELEALRREMKQLQKLLDDKMDDEDD